MYDYIYTIVPPCLLNPVSCHSVTCTCICMTVNPIIGVCTAATHAHIIICMVRMRITLLTLVRHSATLHSPHKLIELHDLFY